MQTSIHVFSKRSDSLRESVLRNSKLGEFRLSVKQEKNPDRKPGWSKIQFEDGPGVINLEWHRSTQTFVRRIVTRGTVSERIAGAFISLVLPKTGTREARSAYK